MYCGSFIPVPFCYEAFRSHTISNYITLPFISPIYFVSHSIPHSILQNPFVFRVLAFALLTVFVLN